MAIEQIKVGFDNFSYVIYCPNKKEAAIVDPGFDGKKSLNFIFLNNLNFRYIILTHYHSDHTADIDKLKGKVPTAKIVSSIEDGKYFDVDTFISDGDNIKVGNINLNFIKTPGHTPGGICIIVDSIAIITGDTLFIDDCGRCDLPGGSFSQMFESLQKIKKLPGELIVYPGHDYGSRQFDTLGNQRKINKTLLAKSIHDFSEI